MMISRLMKHGKKSTAQRILSDAFSLINERTGSDPVDLFETAVKNATPVVEVRLEGLGELLIRCLWRFDKNAV